jgi:hypothetical protein
MNPVALDELVGREAYESIRPAYRDAIIALKRRRRVAVGDRVSVVFENRETLRFQVLEMARVERIDDPAALQHELDVYNELVPGDGELSATLFVELPDLARIKAELDRLVGIDEHVLLEVGARAIRASFDPRQREEDRISAVQYIRFRLDAAAVAAFASEPVHLRIDHPAYAHAAALSPETRASLLADLRGECEDLLPRGGRPPVAAAAVSARVRVVRLASDHLVVEPLTASSSLLGASDPELLRAAEREADALRRAHGRVRVWIETEGDRPRWHVAAGE